MVLLLLFVCASAWGQGNVSNIRTKTIDARKSLQKIDTLTLASPLLFVADSATGCPFPISFFEVQNNYIRFDTAMIQRRCTGATRLQVTYRVLPIDLGRPMFRLDTSLIKRAGIDGNIAFDYAPYEPFNSNPFTTPGWYPQALILEGYLLAIAKTWCLTPT